MSTYTPTVAAPEAEDQFVPEVEELTPEFVNDLIDRILEFQEVLVGYGLHAYQLPFARRIIESVIINDGEEISAQAARQSGKALALDTPLLTTNGWTTMGAVRVGDLVYAVDGTPTKVVGKSQVWEDHRCYRVSFADGSEFIANAAHEWTFWDAEQRKTVTVGTATLAAKGSKYLKNGTSCYRYRNDLPAPLENADADLPVDPYLLGVWLGDGSSYKAEITTADPEIVAAFEAEGFTASYVYKRGAAATYGYRGAGWRSPDSLFALLRGLGLVKNGQRGIEGRKHVPDLYLSGSEKQRLALLQGLMDSDGGVSGKSCEITLTSKELANDALLLIRSLGWKATLSESRASLRGKDCGPRYRVRFHAYADESPFRLARKSSRLPSRPEQEFRLRRTTTNPLVSVEKVESVPTVCIEVDHPSHLYLAGRSLTPTHNSETIANTVATLMVLMPRLAKIFPDLLGRFEDGIWIGLFAPVEGQVETIFTRVYTRLTSARAVEILGDPEIDDETSKPGGVVRTITLKKSGSFVSMMTANPKAKIESRTFHLIIIDEAQGSDDTIVAKSIGPMLAYHSGTMVKSGTPATHKNNFYRSIQRNKRRQTGRGSKQHHFEWDWKAVAKVNPNYGKFIAKEKLRIGEDSDEFILSYQCKWLLDRGMFVTEGVMEHLSDKSQEVVRHWHKSPVVVGIDPARKTDSTVVTVVWVDWDRPDEFGYFDHRVLNWLELTGEDWEEQYAKITEFLANYDCLAVGVDANGVGDAVASRLKVLLPRTEVIPVTSSQQEQSSRFKHLQALIQRQMIGWPGHAKTRRLRTWKRFTQQMIDAERVYNGPNFTVQAPDEPWAHDDYVDSLAIACALTRDYTLPTIEVANNPFFT